MAESIQTLPSFSIDSTNGGELKSEYLANAYVVFYFYPKDNTPGCTKETCDFSGSFKKFSSKNCLIFGISRDNLKSHTKFKEKFKVPFDLLADTDEKVCKLFGVLKDKSVAGKKSSSIERSTFLFDPSGELIKSWRDVKVDGHVADVLSTIPK